MDLRVQFRLTARHYSNLLVISNLLAIQRAIGRAIHRAVVFRRAIGRASRRAVAFRRAIRRATRAVPRLRSVPRLQFLYRVVQ